MKKIFLTLLLTASFVLIPNPSFSSSGSGEVKGQIRNEIKNEIRNRINISTTPGEIKKNILERVREELGKKLAFGARITGEIKSIDDKLLVITSNDKDYEVTITDKTQLRRRFWGKAELSEFSVGNKVNVIGKWTDDAKTKIEAKLIRNLSIQKRWGVFFGDIISKTSNSFIIKTISRGEETVYPSSSTKYINRTEKTMTFQDIAIGHRVRIKGVWDRDLKKITEIDEVKDFSIPVKPTITVIPTKAN